MGLQVDLLTVDGATHVAKLPKATAVASMEELNNDGQLTFTVAEGSTGCAELLAATEGLVRVSLDGTPVAFGVLDRDGDDPTAGPGRAISVTAPGTPVLLSDAIVLGDDDNETQRSFTTATAGRIIRTLVLEAQGRGALQGVTLTFSDTHDSAGRAWSQQWTGYYEAGGKVREVLQHLVDLRLIDFRMVGLQLNLYAANTVLDTDRPNVTLLQRWLTEAPRERARQGKVTHLTALGDGGRLAYVASGVPGRRREGFAQIGGIPDEGTLQLAAEATLQPLSKIQQGYTTSYLVTRGDQRPRPWADFNVGDSIRRGDVRLASGDLEPLRVRSLSVSLDDNGATAVSLELNDLFYEADVANKLRLDALTNGAVVGSAASDFGIDDVKPGTPASIQLTSDTYSIGNGALSAQAIASWPIVTTNHDGTPTTDVAGYEVQWNVNAGGFGTEMARTTAQAMSRSPLPLGGTIQARVRTVDRTGNYSDWRVSDVVPLAKDTTGPPKPSAPLVTSQLGLITIGWDGKADGGTAMPADLEAVEVWQSATQGFTVGDASSKLVEQIRPGGGEAAVRGTEYGALLYFRLRPVDRSGNYGPVSTEGVGSRQYVVNPDIFDGAVGTSKLADLVVTTAKINDLAVNTAKIADLAVGSAKIIDLSVTKLVAGNLKAGVLITEGYLAAGNPFGARVILSAAGLQAYDQYGNEQVRIIPDQQLFEVGVQGGARVRMSTANNPFELQQQWGMLQFFSGNAQWGPGMLWANYSTNNAQAELALSSPSAPGTDPTTAAALRLGRTASGTRYTRFTSSTYQFDSFGTSVDFRLQNTALFQLFAAGGERLDLNIGHGGGGFGAMGIISRNASGGLRDLWFEGMNITFKQGNARKIDLGENFTTAGTPILIDSAADVGLTFRSASGGLLDVVGTFGNNFKVMRAQQFHAMNSTTGGGFVQASDRRLKANVLDAAPGQLELVEALRLRTWTAKDAAADAERATGLVAQEVQPLLPHAVTGLGDGDLLGLDLYSMTMVLVGAVQELSARVKGQRPGVK